ncbi:hypothetical protein BOX15_Mlig018938g2, partial [Macrostomum lignano]
NRSRRSDQPSDEFRNSPECPYRLTEVSTHQDLARPPGVWELRQIGALAKTRPDELTAPPPPPEVTSSTALVIPRRAAAWFNYRSVHRIERLAFPKYFTAGSGCRGPALYMAYRNCMIDTYRANPRRRLTLARCSARLRGDIKQLAKLYSFLEHWGLINLHTEPGLAAPCHLLATSSGSTTASSNSSVPANHPASLRLTESMTPDVAPGLRDFGPAPSISTAAASSSTRPGASSFGLRLEQAASSFGSRGGGRGGWSEAEVLALLEAVELYGEDWARVADRVGSGRTQEECIVQMLRLPIADPYLDGAEEALGPLASADSSLAPFSKAANPAMCTVAFLASSVDPRVGAAAALAALAEYGRLDAEAGSAGAPSEGKEKTAAADSKKKPAATTAQLEAAASRIAEAALRAGAEKSASLAESERSRVRALLAVLTDAQMRRLELKLRHLSDLEAHVQREIDSAEAQSQRVFEERVSLHEQLQREHQRIFEEQQMKQQKQQQQQQQQRRMQPPRSRHRPHRPGSDDD